MPRPSHPPRLDYSNYEYNRTWRRVQITKLLIMQFSPFSRHLIPLRSKYPPQRINKQRFIYFETCSALVIRDIYYLPRCLCEDSRIILGTHYNISRILASFEINCVTALLPLRYYIDSRNTESYRLMFVCRH
jgi:hypothetical protein